LFRFGEKKPDQFSKKGIKPLDRDGDRGIIQPVACEGSPVSPETADRSKPNTPLPKEFCETP